MKFLVKNKYFIILLLSHLLISETCINNWINNNSVFKNKNFVVNATVNNDSTKLFYDYLGRIRFESNNSIIISNSHYTSKYYMDTNELYMDNPDKTFNESIKFLVNIDKLKKSIKLNSNNTYILKNKLKFGKTKLYFNKNCNKLDSIVINKNKYNVNIHSISIDTLDIDRSQELFLVDTKVDDIKIYDFRSKK